MKIKRLEIKGYKSIEHLVLEDVPSLMVLAGANGAGKSNVVEALAFFGAVVRDGLDRAIKDFGGLNVILPKNEDSEKSKEMLLKIEINLNSKNFSYLSKLSFSKNENFIIEEELLKDNQIVFISNIENTKKIKTILNEYRNKLAHQFNGKQNNTAQYLAYYSSEALQEFGLTQAKPSKFSTLLMIKDFDYIELFNFIANIKIFRIDPFAAKYPSRDINNSDELNPNGNNIATALAKLEKNDDFRETLMEWLELIVPQMQEINASANRLDGSVGLSFTETSGKQFPAHLISDGTIYVICILTAILSRYNDYGITIIEEPERGIHPKAIGEIIGFIRDKMAESGKHTVILTTHSESVVRNSEVEELFFVQQENGATQVKSLRGSSVDKNKIPLDTAWLTNILGGGSPW